MKEIILNYFIDRSDRPLAQYALLCPSCGWEWRSTPISAAETPSVEMQKKMAAVEAEHAFDVCLLCGSLVCRSCMVSVGEMEMCRNCGGRMK